jgi:N-acetylmuramoyl-L-alanine amidase-like protein
MKALLPAAVAMLATPALARAAATLTMREVPLHGARTLESASPPAFDMVGLHWRGSGTVTFRTRSPAARWSAWHAAAPEPEDGPDHPAQPGWRIGNPYWTGDANAIAYRLHGRVTRLRAYFVESPVDDLPPRRLSIAASPPVITRLSWGAIESIRRAAPVYAPALRYALVHHTAGTNSYSRSESAAIVRGIEIYHVKGNGWNDIGYNFLVDKYGQVFEGRYGGVDKNVVGAHAQGFNTGSVGVAVIGTYTDAAPPVVAQKALANLLSWRLDLAHVDPLSTLTVASGGNPRYPPGVPVFLHAVSGHRDTGFTTCPGNALYARLGAIARTAAATGLPKLYSPSVSGQPGGPIEFRARLSTALPWTITVTDATGQPVGSTSGTGTDVRWLWDATTLPPARYGWTIAAGDVVRPATGFIGSAPVPLAFKRAGVKPTAISPNGDGVADKATISYTLSAPATVSAVLEGADGADLGTLFSQARTAGTHTFVFAADGVADGRFAIVLTASNRRTTVTRTLHVTVDRTVSGLVLSPRAVSPNGDGRNDVATVTFALARPATVHAELRRGSRTVTTLLDASEQPGAQSLAWNGMAADQRVPDGSYTIAVTVTTSLGTTSYTLPLRVDTVAPRLTAVSFARHVFRLSEPAVVTLVTGGRAYRHAFRAGVFTFPVARAVRRYTVSAVDAAGNVSVTLRAR